LEKACWKRTEINDEKLMICDRVDFGSDERNQWLCVNRRERIERKKKTCSQETLADESTLSGVRALTKTCVVARVNPATTTINKLQIPTVSNT